MATRPQVKISPAQYRVMLGRMLTKQEGAGETRQQANQLSSQLQAPLPGIPQPKASAMSNQVPPSKLGSSVQEGLSIWDNLIAGTVGEQLFQRLSGGRGKEFFAEQFAVNQMDPRGVKPEVKDFIDNLVGSQAAAPGPQDLMSLAQQLGG